MTTFADWVAEQIRRAGIAPDDPGLVQLREWNRQVYAMRPGR